MTATLLQTETTFQGTVLIFFKNIRNKQKKDSENDMTWLVCTCWADSVVDWVEKHLGYTSYKS